MIHHDSQETIGKESASKAEVRRGNKDPPIQYHHQTNKDVREKNWISTRHH
jgi:hypothetical protein